MTQFPRVALCSWWRNDSARNLQQRAWRLLSKSYPAARWLWLVGDSSDDTYARLLEVAGEIRPYRSVELLQIDTGICGEDPATRRRRLGATVNLVLERVREEDEYLLLHESDLVSPPDLVERFVEHAQSGRCPIAGWPILEINDHQVVFYDIWAYRSGGKMFSNLPPFSACYRPDAPFQVDSVGSVWMFDAADARRGARFGAEACLTMCAQLQELGRTFWVDPTLVVVQPRDLWTPTSTT